MYHSLFQEEVKLFTGHICREIDMAILFEEEFDSVNAIENCALPFNVKSPREGVCVLDHQEAWQAILRLNVCVGSLAQE